MFLTFNNIIIFHYNQISKIIKNLYRIKGMINTFSFNTSTQDIIETKIFDLEYDSSNSNINNNFHNFSFPKEDIFMNTINDNLFNFEPIIKNQLNEKSKEKNDNFKIIDKTTKENIQKEIKEKIYLKKPFKEKKKLGRKIKSNECLGEHNKFSDDNVQMKLKNGILKSVFQFINKKIKIFYSDINKSSLSKMQLLKLKQKSKERSKAEYNKNFLNKTLKSIFSEEVSGKYLRYNPNHNKDLIEKLINDKDETKREIFYKLFNLTFMDCLNHFRGSHAFEELKGMNQFEQYLNEIKSVNDDDMYKNVLKYYLVNYEREVMDRKERNREKRKQFN